MRTANWRRAVGVLLVAAVLALVASAVQLPGSAATAERNRARNVILLIGDGMGYAQMTLARLYKGEPLAMDEPGIAGWISTAAADSLVTDSAAAGTALATGYKVKNDVVGITPDGAKPTTILEAARAHGKAVGLVTTTRITHATPAAFAAHIENRDLENEIAAQLLDNRVDVLLGGGRRHFVPQSAGGKRTDGRNLLSEAARLGYTVITDAHGVQSITPGMRVVGLLADSDLSYEIDRAETDQPSLAELTRAAVRALSADRDGFFLMVEGGKIDHACHSNDPATAVRDTLAFDEAVAVALQFARQHPDTLVVVTADHETGGMSLGANGKYELRLDVLRRVTRSAEFMASKLNRDRSNAVEVVAQYAGVKDLTEQEVALIKDNQYPSNAIGQAISTRALVGWTTTAHTGTVVPLIAYGACASQFCGYMDNTDVARLMADAMRIELRR